MRSWKRTCIDNRAKRSLNVFGCSQGHAQLVFPREGYFAIPGKAGMQIPFPGKSRDPGIFFYLIKLEKATF
jgi:hypothetical protein